MNPKPQGSFHSAGPLTLEDFAAALLDRKPFSSNRVNEPSDYDVDVESIHGRQFDLLVELATETLAGRQGVGAMILGGAGVGKSHLLSRLYRWAVKHEAVYVFLHNVQASPERLPYYFLRVVMSILSRREKNADYTSSRLYKALKKVALSALKERGYSLPTTESKCREALRSFTNEISDNLHVRDLLIEYFCSINKLIYGKEKSPDERRAKIQMIENFLSGELIEPEAAERFDLPIVGLREIRLQDEGASYYGLADESHCERVLLTLSGLLALADTPLIICIDQFDNLKQEQVKAFSRFLHALIDHAPNLLLITSGVQETLLRFKTDGIIPEAAWDRIAKFGESKDTGSDHLQLARIPVEPDGAEIIRQRLEEFQQGFRGPIPEVDAAIEADPFFPIGEKWYREKIEQGNILEARPRDVINWAHNAWRVEQRRLRELGVEKWFETWGIGFPPDVPGDSELPEEPASKEHEQSLLDKAVRAKIEESIQKRHLNKGSLPPDSDNISTLLENLLSYCEPRTDLYTLVSHKRIVGKNNARPSYDLEVLERVDNGRGSKDILNALAVLTTDNATSLAASLRKLKDVKKKLDHRLLVTDSRCNFSLGAKGQEHYDSLVSLGTDAFRHLKMNFEDHAKLDALEMVIGQARSNDFEIEFAPGKTRQVTAEEVIESLHRQDLFRKQPILRELLTETDPTDGDAPPEVPTVQLDSGKIETIIRGELGLRLGLTTSAIATVVLRNLVNQTLDHEEAHRQIKTVAIQMHEKGKLYADTYEDGLFLQLKK